MNDERERERERERENDRQREREGERESFLFVVERESLRLCLGNSRCSQSRIVIEAFIALMVESGGARVVLTP